KQKNPASAGFLLYHWQPRAFTNDAGEASGLGAAPQQINGEENRNRNAERPEQYVAQLAFLKFRRDLIEYALPVMFLSSIVVRHDFRLVYAAAVAFAFVVIRT